MTASLRASFFWFWLCCVATSSAGDWPQILGPQRNGEAESESLANSWPKDGPKTVWSIPVGSGFAGVAVAGNKVALFHRIADDREELAVLNAKNGDTIWSKNAPTSYAGSIVEDNGPRSVPLIHNEVVISFGAEGLLSCYKLADGAQLWKRDTHADFHAPSGYFGAGSSPIVVDDKVIVNVGGSRDGAGVVAFSLKDGKDVWKATNEAASYSSPVLVTVDETLHLICITRLTAVSLDPANGSVRFTFPFGNRGPTVNAANPTVSGDRLFLTASYGIGSVYGEIKPDKFELLWKSDEVLSSQYTTCIEDEGYLYGVHGRQDAGIASLRCIDPRLKKICWEKRGFGYATLIKADGKLLAIKTDGEFVMLKLDGSEYKELARAKCFENETRALPALSNGKLYARDTQSLKCFELGQGN